MCRIVGIVIEHGKDNFGYWEGFNLTEAEENAIWNILSNMIQKVVQSEEHEKKLQKRLESD